ncbi:MAG: hypothetical protein IJX24_00940 [Oscillospiraceae bacterium]|nr:hypothetical protein [Oscillospiraceae bacterium]
MNNEFTLRPFETEDIFLMTTIIGKIGVSQIIDIIKMNSFRDIVREDGDEEKYKAVGKAVGMKVIAMIIEKLPECKNEIYRFLASLSGKTNEEIAKQPPVITVRMIKKFISMDGFSDFFMEVAELLPAEKTE